VTAGVPALGPLVFVDDLDDPQLAPADRHHFERVLRIAPGAAVVASDGLGRWRPCRFWPVLEPTGAVGETAPPHPPITVAFAVPKGDRPELVVQKLTELGVDRIVPMSTARSVVRWPADRAARNLDRLAAIARAAAAQSRRCRIPEIAPLVTFADASRWPAAARADLDGGPPSLDHPTVLIGPEGGWTDEERTVAIPSFGLGDGVLRAETAAIAAATLLAALRAGLVRHP
jgi:16S rRNA (uracil1498-N3)-methyltransferase